MGLAASAKLGPYEVVAPLGAGGMGEVYRARDTRLQRVVAIKVLPANYSSDPERLRRFEQEARAAAALNHPNLLAIYDIGTQQGSPYIITELLEGETLRQRLRGGPLPVRKASDYALQVARGLAAAHERGIVHRDLKPENIFLTRDGRVKILDFGVAKLIEPEEAARTNAPTIETTPGVVVGTVGYMSPEQVRGQAADQRSDLFSFGAILYEMLAGQRAFKGATSADTMSSILKDDPPELTDTNRNIPPALERIVRHCLEKNPEERFQSARDVAFDLESLSGISTASAAAVAAKLPRRRLLPALIAVAIVLALAAGLLLGARLVKTPEPRFHQITFRRGWIGNARFSPDGDTIVYNASWEGNRDDVYTGRTDSPGERPMGIADATVLAISNAGELAILQHPTTMGGWTRRGTLAVMPLAGGAPRAILNDVQEADWSADGKTLAIIRYVPEKGAWRLEYPVGNILYETHAWISHPRISPGGDTIAFVDHPTPDGDDRGAIAAIAVASKKKTTLTQVWSSAQGVAWSPSGDAIWFTASDSGTIRALFSVTLAGKLRALARVPTNLFLEDVNRNGRILLRSDNSRFELQALGPGEKKERELDWLDWSRPADLSPDGRTLFFVEEGEGGGTEYTIYMRATDGSPAVALGHGVPTSVSPDGQWVLSRSLNSSPAQFVLLPTGAGGPRQITHDQLNHFAGEWFPDGKHILCECSEPGQGMRYFVVDVDSGQAQPITPEGLSDAHLSPDGKTFLVRDVESKFELWPVNGGHPAPVPGLGPRDVPTQWASDGKAVYFTTQDSSDSFPRRKMYLFDLASGHKRLVQSYGPSELSGVGGVSPVRFSSDGKSYMYGYVRTLSGLYAVDGLK